MIKQNKVIDILIVIFVLLLTAIVLVSAWVNHKERVGDEMAREQQTVEETETITEEVPAEVQTVVADSTQTQEGSAFYQALKGLTGGSDSQPDALLAYMVEAADSGNMDAQYFAGEMYLQGIGTAPDHDKAAKYFRQAYDNGNERAFAIYGKLCFLGDGAVQDYEKAYEAFRSISEPEPDILCALGLMNIYGMGVRVDYEKAKTYLDQAEAAGELTAKTAKESIKGAVYERRLGESESSNRLRAVAVTDYGAENAELAGFVETVYIQMKSQEQYTSFGEELARMAGMSPAMVAKVAIFGRENWLFFQNDADGSSYHDYVGDNAFSEKEMLAIKENLEAQKHKAEAAGARFVLLIYPNKEVIYCDKMPSYIVREDETTRTDKLVAYLKKNSDIEIIYPKEQFMEWKDTLQLYYSTDTHCNMMGCFVGLSELLNQVYGKSLKLDGSDYDIHMTDYVGDIGHMIGREDRYAIDTVYFLPKHKVPEEDQVDASMMLIGDSFSEFLNTESAYFFKKGVAHYMIMDYEYNYKKAYDAALAAGSADLVVWECAERNIERLK